VGNVRESKGDNPKEWGGGFGKKKKEQELRKIYSKYKNRVGKLLPIADLSNIEEFFNILKENFMQI